MTTESKKPLRAKDPAGLSDAETLTRLQHDASLVYEMLLVLRNLRDAASAAAEPFLHED